MSSLQYDGYNYFSPGQYAGFLSVAMLSCTVSISSSCAIVKLIWNRKKERQNLYHRLVMGLSISDILYTSGLLLQPFLLPRETNYPLALGTSTTCTWIGFIYPFFTSSYCYNCFLAVYFLCMVRYGKKETEIANWMEPWVHILAFGFPLIYSILCVSLDLVNPNPFLAICNAIPYPVDCVFFLNDVECIRSEMAPTLVLIHDAVSVIFVLVGMVCTFLVYWSVRKQSRTMLRYSVGGSASDQRRRMEAAVAAQAIYYAAAYLVGFTAVIVVEILKAVYSGRYKTVAELGNSKFYLVTFFFIWLAFPLQGLFNCLIYLRPRYTRLMYHNPQNSTLWAIQTVLADRPTSAAAAANNSRSRPHSNGNGNDNGNANDNNSYSNRRTGISGILDWSTRYDDAHSRTSGGLISSYRNGSNDSIASSNQDSANFSFPVFGTEENGGNCVGVGVGVSGRRPRRSSHVKKSRSSSNTSFEIDTAILEEIEGLDESECSELESPPEEAPPISALADENKKSTEEATTSTVTGTTATITTITTTTPHPQHEEIQHPNQSEEEGGGGGGGDDEEQQIRHFSNGEGRNNFDGTTNNYGEDSDIDSDNGQY